MIPSMFGVISVLVVLFCYFPTSTLALFFAAAGTHLFWWAFHVLHRKSYATAAVSAY